MKKLKHFLATPVKNGYSPVCTDKPTSKVVLGLGALTGTGLDLTQVKWVPESNTQADKFPIESGDFLVSRSNTLDKVGRAALYRGGLSNCSYPDLMMKFRVDEGKIIPDFMELILQSAPARKHFMRCASGTSSTMAKITKSVVESLRVPEFSMQQQQSIVKTAREWDNAIEKTEALIMAKEKQFAWLLRALISEPSKGHKWKSKKLNNLVNIKKGKQLNRLNLTKTGLYPAWNGGVTPSGYTDSFNTSTNTITISEGGNSCGFVNYCEEPFWCGGHCYALLEVNEQINPKFLFYFLKSHEPKIMRLRVGSGLPNIQKKDIDKFPIFYPDLETQIKIAELLTLANQEISLLKNTLEQYRSQKRGLMQKLLTGEWQVSSSQPVAEDMYQEASA
ncbi:restriction endonuclease subunit S [Vibrio cholerae]|uniref:restriction endonuclease subunit S n=1 Tax=Vibrio cholerae TaxID=666 RepID=UPI002271DB12|nr:restriction endonuclease subunit S [Vibrio cholerae]MCX9582414.1 restriction endonuclease subunit S [Vibrio cholerae]MCX9585841.1 restriction endonuclease subunit S [Vibrio cholerae]